MRKFALKKIAATKNEEDEVFSIYKLIINDKCPYDAFCKKIFKSNQKPELIKLFANLKTVCEGKEQQIPAKKFGMLKRPKSDKYVDYELKTLHLRLYFFRDEGNKRIIVMGGKKTNQEKDILKFRQIKKDYFNLKEL